MKKIAVLLVLSLAIAGSVIAQESVTADLSKIQVPLKNPDPLTEPYGWYLITFPEGTFPANLPWAEYTRIRVVFEYFRANGNVVRQGNGNAQVTLVYDVSGTLFENDMGPGPNTPVKFFNVGGGQNATGPVSSPEGAGIKPLSRAPGGIILQRQGPSSYVRFIELKEVTFLKG